MQSRNVAQFVPRTERAIVVPGSFFKNVSYFPERNFLITGITLNSVGAALASVTVRLYNSSTNLLLQTVISDGAGNYSFVVDKTELWYVVGYLTGSPDVEGTSLRTLAGS